MAGLGKDAATLEQHQQWTEAPRTSEDSPPTTAQTATAGWTLTQRDTAAAHQQPVLTTRMGLHHSGPNFVRTLVIPVFIQDRSAEEDPDPTPGRIKSPRGSRQTVCRALCGLAQQVGDTGQVGRSTAPVPPAAPRQQAGDTGQVGRSTAPGRRWHLANRSGTLGKLAGQLQDRSAEEDPDPTRAASSRAAGSAEQCAGHCAGRRRPRTVSHWKHPVTRGPSDNLLYIGYHTRSRRPGGPGTSRHPISSQKGTRVKCTSPGLRCIRVSAKVHGPSLQPENENPAAADQQCLNRAII